MRIDHLVDRGAAIAQISEEGETFVSAGVIRVEEACLAPELEVTHPLNRPSSASPIAELAPSPSTGFRGGRRS
jgi:hypothetical protein